MFNQGSSSARGNIFSPIAQTYQLPISNQAQTLGLQNTAPQLNQFQQQQQLQQLQQIQQQQQPLQQQQQQLQQQQFSQNVIQNNYVNQQQDQQQQQQQQQLQQQQPQYQQWSNQNQFPEQQGYQNQGFQFIQPAQDYTNPDAIPQKIDLKFYGIEEKIDYIKSLQFLRFQNGQILYHHNIIQRSFSEIQAKIIIKNFREFQELVYDKVYQVQTEEGYWLMSVSDVDRVYMCFFHANFSLDWAYTVLTNFMQTLNDKELFQINSGTEIQVQIQAKLQKLCSQIEMELLQQKEPILKVEKTKVDFQQNSFTIGISEQTVIAQVALISEKNTIQQIHPAFQASNLWKDFKDNFQSITSICICILLVIVVILLIYKFILQDIILAVQSPNQQQNQVKKHLFTKLQHTFHKQQ